MKKSVILVLGLGLMQFGCLPASQDGGGDGGSGGSGGAPGTCTDSTECNDDSVCTIDFCDPDTSECANLPVQEETTCVFMGSAGLCSEGACAPFCDVEDCNDGNDCTQDNCDSMTAACSNPNEPDDTTCTVGTDPGLCQSGVCQGRCADAGTRCDDAEECTLDDCNPADGICSNTPQTGQSCDFMGAPGICTVQGVCEAAGLCADAAERCTANANNECANDTCDPETGNCGSANVANDTPCANDAGTCQDGTCVLNSIEAIEFLAIDCELLANSAPLPVGAKVTPLDLAFAGQSVDVVVEDAVILPAPLVCNFLEADFSSSEVDNSVVGNDLSNANITNVTLNSFLVDGTAGNARVSPHEVVLFDFATACGCPDPANPPDPDTCSTGPGIVAPTFRRDGAAETIPPGPTPFPIIPTAAGTVDFTIPYADLALELRNLVGSITVPVVCVGGACGALDICSELDRGDIASPRIMYDATCNKAQAAAGDCTPFLVFTDVADVCKGVGVDFADAPDCCDTGDFTGMDPTRPIDVNCRNDANRASCCAALATDYPTATAAQQPQLPVSAAP